MIALFFLFLLMLLSGCGSTRIVYVQVPPVPIPASLTAETPQPLIPTEMTWGDSLVLNIEALSALALCNTDKAGIRKIEESKSEISINSRAD
ncbi:Rz1-like lysis system protein LysC [Limnobaculum xujianqingii]